MKARSLDTLIRGSTLLRRIAWPALAARRHLLSRQGRAVRLMANRMQAMLVGDVQIRVPEIEGTFWINPASDLFRRILSHGHYEPEVLAVALDMLRPDADVIDVGANIGLFSVALAGRLTSGRLLAVEPSAVFERLERNLADNGLASRSILFRGAAGSTDGEMTLNYVAGREEYASLGNLVHPSIAGAASQSATVPVSTIDALVERHGLSPGLIKVDVEGFEHAVFAGARETLRRHRPAILSELSDPLLRSNGSSSAQVVAMLKSAGYTVTDAEHPDILPGAREYCNILCVAN